MVLCVYDYCVPHAFLMLTEARKVDGSLELEFQMLCGCWESSWVFWKSIQCSLPSLQLFILSNWICFPPLFIFKSLNPAYVLYAAIWIWTNHITSVRSSQVWPWLLTAVIYYIVKSFARWKILNALRHTVSHSSCKCPISWETYVLSWP